ncbi:unnamed protein product [Thlaspi arvense]|uniref:Reverse transcriptase zinc-binding domain-containing protein n=1 Tax=Thlaspi arvense TaxID=13288 RepID=A0AAU9RBE1_THLAR|nr:unnamed protein product [Thlaspi arvense]
MSEHWAFRRWLVSNKVSFGALLETHIKEPNLNKVLTAICPNWSFLSNHAADEDGQIILVWKQPFSVVLLRLSKQTLTCKVSFPGISDFIFTDVYAANTLEDRNDLWINLLETETALSLRNTAWLVGGNFNETLHPSEHSQPDFNQITSPMINFKDCLHQLELRDHRYQGTKFTWSNKQPADPIAKKLDHALINEHWLSTFPQSLAQFLAPDISNHSPCCINLASAPPSAGTLPFKFYNYLASHPDFLGTARTAFNAIHTLVGIDGREATSAEDVGNLAASYFRNILGPPMQFRITSPKEEGGLGIKNFNTWNRVCSLKLLWLLLFRTESIWVNWIHQSVIKDKSIWDLKEKQSHTWLFKKLLRLRDTMLMWVRIKPGDGRTTMFWSDPWTPFGPLIKFIGPMGPRLLGISRDAIVASIWRANCWHLVPARSQSIEELHCYMTLITFNSSSDQLLWQIDGSTKANFSTKTIYHQIREQNQVVDWSPIIWLKRGISKHKCPAWLFILNRCPTRDRLLSWGLTIEPLCLLCNMTDESRDHLFFECEYSFPVWSKLARKLRFSTTMRDWSGVVDGLLSITPNNSRKYLMILAWQATIYEIWRERNNRLHRSIHKHPDLILKGIELTINNRISAFRLQNPHAASDAMQLLISEHRIAGLGWVSLGHRIAGLDWALLGFGPAILAILFAVSSSQHVCNPLCKAKEPFNCDKIDTFNRTGFPKNFIFGAATSAYQIEGSAHRALNGWDYYTHRYQEEVPDNSSGDLACDSYNLYKEDVALLKRLKAQAYRFSIAWSRVLPKGRLIGGLDENGITYYNKLINELVANEIDTYLTCVDAIHRHRTICDYISLGCSPNFGRRIRRLLKPTEDFKNYAELLFSRFGDRVKYWITLNQPFSLATKGYGDGSYPPGRCTGCEFGGNSGTKPYKVSHHQLLAHAETKSQGGKIRTTLIRRWFTPLNETNDLDEAASKRAFSFIVGWYICSTIYIEMYGDYPKIMRDMVGDRLPRFTPAQSELVKRSLDFLGLNYYITQYATDTPIPKLPSVITDPGITLGYYRNGISIGVQAPSFVYYPPGFRMILSHIRQNYGNPLTYITENGVADYGNLTLPDALADNGRIQNHCSHLSCLKCSIDEGSNVRGYFAWSLMDNYEFGNGYTLRFGMNWFNFTNPIDRREKDSGKWFSKFIAK